MVKLILFIDLPSTLDCQQTILDPSLILPLECPEISALYLDRIAENWPSLHHMATLALRRMETNFSLLSDNIKDIKHSYSYFTLA